MSEPNDREEFEGWKRIVGQELEPELYISDDVWFDLWFSNRTKDERIAELTDWRQSQRGCVQCVLKGEQIADLAAKVRELEEIIRCYDRTFDPNVKTSHDD